LSVVKVDLPYIFEDKDRHGTVRVYVRKFGRKIRMRETAGTSEFLKAYSEALDALNAAAGAVTAESPGKATAGTLGWLAARYMTPIGFGHLHATSQATRRQVIESCLLEPLRPGSDDTFSGVPISVLSPKHIQVLRDRKKGFPGAANNRLKYLSTMFGWAVEEGLLKTNPARDVRRVKYRKTGFHQWTVEEVRQFEARHPVGTQARLAMALLLYLGVRKQDVVGLGPQHIKDGWIRLVPQKTLYIRSDVSEKPVLPTLAGVIASTRSGGLTFLVTSFRKAFSVKGFGNWFRDRCDEATLPRCSAHGLRKAGAAVAVEEGATDRQLMALYDWSSAGQATTYTKGADKRKLAGEASQLLEDRMANKGLTHRIDPPEKTASNQ
jgi:integrase